MPYKIVKKDDGFMVCDKNKCFSNKPLSKKKALKQRIAIAISESKKNKKDIRKYFV